MTRPDFTMNELIVLETEVNGFMVVSGERVATATDPNCYPFEHAVTFRLCPRDAERLGQDTITVAESAILQDCELPKATELPAVEDTAEVITAVTEKTETQQPTLF